MPMYEYMTEEDGTRITLLRPSRDADKPVDDPEGLGRTFRRRLSTFEVGASAKSKSVSPPAGGCPCGNPYGPCGG